MYKVVIVDDEVNCVEVLEILISENHKDLVIIEKFNSSVKALEYLQNNVVDLVFLDIQMPFLTGIDLLQQFQNHTFQVIFTTAFDQFAINAIKLSALDYLLKPIDEDLLSIAIDKFKKNKNKTDIQSQLTNLLQQYQAPQALQAPSNSIPNGKITVALQDKILFIDPIEIIYCQSNDNYTTFILKNGEKVLASKTIKYFEDILSSQGFLRPHQSYLINGKYIEQYNKKDGGCLIMVNGTSIPVSRNRKEEIMLMLK